MHILKCIHNSLDKPEGKTLEYFVMCNSHQVLQQWKQNQLAIHQNQNVMKLSSAVELRFLELDFGHLWKTASCHLQLGFK